MKNGKEVRPNGVTILRTWAEGVKTHPLYELDVPDGMAAPDAEAPRGHSLKRARAYADGFRPLTQTLINAAFEDARKEWADAVAASGLTQPVFLATDQTGFVARFMTEYEEARQQTIAHGFTAPDIIPGLKVTVTTHDD